MFFFFNDTATTEIYTLSLHDALLIFTGTNMTQSAMAFLATLDDDQLKTATMEYENKQRLEWHFIPKDQRKGLQIKHMNPQQRKTALKLLRDCLSESGYDTVKTIMATEGL